MITLPQTLVDGLRQDLMSTRVLFDWLVKDWAVPPREVARWELGLSGDRFAVPVREHGRLVDMRLVDRNGVAATTSWSPRHAGRRPWPLDGVDRATEVWVVEDEPDALCLRALGLTAITLTADWGRWGAADARRWAPMVRRRRVRLLLFDGRLARRVGGDLAGAATEVRLLDPNLPVRRRARAAVSLLGWALAEFLGLSARTRPLRKP